MSANRLRFRARCGGKEGMLGPFSVFDYRACQLGIGPSACDVMQSTGLTDVHGKEIFEGDLMRWWGPREYDDPPPSKRPVAIVKWDREDEFVGFVREEQNRRKDRPYWGDEDGEGWEIIGNIHQHPELVK